MLNWNPLKDVTATVFSSLNDKRVIEALNFTEFEKLFQAKKQPRGDRTRELVLSHIELDVSTFDTVDSSCSYTPSSSLHSSTLAR